MNRTFVQDLIRRHDGLKLKPYKDSVGKLTIGYGRNLDDRGINLDEAEFLLDNDINAVFSGLTSKIPSFGSLDNVRQAVLMDMGYNLGLLGLLGFTKMLAAVEKRDFETAAAEMLNSTWAKQVGDRATEDAALMRKGGN